MKISSILNTKIATGALSALEKIPTTLWKHSSKYGLSGYCLANTLALASNASTQCSNDVYMIMERMVLYSNDHDLNICLDQPDLSISCIDFLYGWMVEKKMSASCFSKFASALERSCHGHDISILQKFQSRSVYAERKEKRTTSTGVSSSYPKSEDENEDEL